MDTTEEDAPKRRERPRRDSETLTSFPHPLSKETDLAMGRGRWGKKKSKAVNLALSYILW